MLKNLPIILSGISQIFSYHSWIIPITPPINIIPFLLYQLSLSVFQSWLLISQYN